ncbi:hypothetical protein C0J52_06115 [Blattella germanica]|nr:hypothetical protein C0J52_06115 [Blattella germanica]
MTDGVHWLITGHGADVKCVHWHPQKGLIISGSKDNQQPVKLWDPKTGQSLATLHAHKSTVMDIKWNSNGNWLVTASRDHLLKLFDLRNLSQEVQTFRGHKKEASSVAWHPYHEDEPAVIPGMGPEDKVETVASPAVAQIPGLDFDSAEDRRSYHKKNLDEESDEDEISWKGRKLTLVKDPITEVLTQLIETNPPPGVIPLSQLQPQYIIIYGKLVPVEGNPGLANAIAAGPMALQRYIDSGDLEELADVVPHLDDNDDFDEYDDYDDNMDLETMSDIELPAPLPSSVFARKSNQQQQQQQPKQQPAPVQPQPQPQPPSQTPHHPRKTRFRPPAGDLDLRQTPGSNFPPGPGPGPIAMADQDFRRLQMDSDLRRLGSPMLPRHIMDEDMRSHQGFDRDMREGIGGDMDLRNNPGIPPLMPPSQFVGAQFDSDFRKQNNAIPPRNAGSPLRRERDHMMRENIRDPYHEEDDGPPDDYGRGMPREDQDGRHHMMGGPQFPGHAPRGMMDNQDNWGPGPRKRRWGDPLIEEEENSRLSFGEHGPGDGNFRHGGNFSVSPVERGNSPSNGRNFGLDREDNYIKRGGGGGGGGRGGPNSWGGREGSYQGQNESMHHQQQHMEGTFRGRGGRGGGFSNRGRGGSRGRYGGPRGPRGGRGPKRGHF